MNTNLINKMMHLQWGKLLVNNGDLRRSIDGRYKLVNKGDIRPNIIFTP